MKDEVKLISAAWCKRCHTMKPDIQTACALYDIDMTIVDFDELEESDPLKLSVTSLPTILYRTASSGVWEAYTAAMIPEWKSKLATKAVPFDF